MSKNSKYVPKVERTVKLDLRCLAIMSIYDADCWDWEDDEFGCSYQDRMNPQVIAQAVSEISKLNDEELQELVDDEIRAFTVADFADPIEWEEEDE